MNNQHIIRRKQTIQIKKPNPRKGTSETSDSS